MQSLLHQLENNEAILLMYLADELSGEDRAEVEQMLSTDAALRAELEELRALQARAFGGLDGYEAHARLPVSEGVAVRQAMRVMRQWQIAHAQAPPPEESVKDLRFPWWSYPLTTAAAVLIAFLVWWGNRPEQVERNRYVQQPDAIPGPADLAAYQSEMAGDLLIDSLDTSEEDLVKLAMNRPVDAAIERLEAQAARPHDVDAIFLNASERNW
jgi:hypothetical protein